MGDLGKDVASKASVQPARTGHGKRELKASWAGDEATSRPYDGLAWLGVRASVTTGQFHSSTMLVNRRHKE